jgi:hypothetical protein
MPPPRPKQNGDQRVLAVGFKRAAGVSGHVRQAVFADQLAVDGMDAILAKRFAAGRTGAYGINISVYVAFHSFSRLATDAGKTL